MTKTSREKPERRAPHECGYCTFCGYSPHKRYCPLWTDPDNPEHYNSGLEDDEE